MDTHYVNEVSLHLLYICYLLIYLTTITSSVMKLV